MIRRLLTKAILTTVLMTPIAIAPAQAQPGTGINPAHSDIAAIEESKQLADTPAPGREQLVPSEPGFDNNSVPNKDGRNWTSTKNPKEKIAHGSMRSDRDPIPGGFSKEEADRAETQEAQERKGTSRQEPIGRGLLEHAQVSNCKTYWPSPYKVCGAIRVKYEAIGGPASFLTWPRSDELGVPDGVGRRNEFINGFIY